jgi:flotillin
VAQAEANRKAVAAKNVKQAEALTESYVAQELSEKQRALRDKASKTADIVVPAEIDKQKIEIEAEAEAEKIRRIAKGNADALFAMKKAEADGINAILTKRAEGFAKLVEAAGGSSEKAVQMMIADNLQSLIRTQVDAIKNIKFDKVVVWDNGGSGKDGKTSTANFLQNFLQMVPPLKSIFEQAGAEMPSFMQGAGEKMQSENDVNNATLKKIVEEKKNDAKKDDAKK